jgi:hypothetical protein
MKPMTQNEYFLLWKKYLTNLANELSLDTRISASVTGELEKEPHHHLWQGMLKGPHSRHIEVDIKVASESDDKEIEFTLVPECIFCAYSYNPIHLESSNHAVTEFLNNISLFDWQPKEYRIANQHRGYPPRFYVGIDFPENKPWTERFNLAELRAGSVSELLLFGLKKRDELKNLIAKFPCDPWKVIRLLTENERHGAKIPLDIFVQLENLSLAQKSNPVEVLSEKSNCLSCEKPLGNQDTSSLCKSCQIQVSKQERDLITLGMDIERCPVCKSRFYAPESSSECHHCEDRNNPSRRLFTSWWAQLIFVFVSIIDPRNEIFTSPGVFFETIGGQLLGTNALLALVLGWYYLAQGFEQKGAGKIKDWLFSFAAFLVLGLLLVIVGVGIAL